VLGKKEGASRRFMTGFSARRPFDRTQGRLSAGDALPGSLHVASQVITK
jgi:hypothetical protein